MNYYQLSDSDYLSLGLKKIYESLENGSLETAGAFGTYCGNRSSSVEDSEREEWLVLAIRCYELESAQQDEQMANHEAMLWLNIYRAQYALGFSKNEPQAKKYLGKVLNWLDDCLDSYEQPVHFLEPPLNKEGSIQKPSYVVRDCLLVLDMLIGIEEVRDRFTGWDDVIRRLKEIDE